MLISIAMMFLVGMSMGWICKKIHLFILLFFLDLFLTDHMIRCHRNCTWSICVARDRRFYFEYFIGSKKDRSYYYFNESGIVIRS